MPMIRYLYRTFSVFKLHDVYNYDVLTFITFAMNDRPRLFEEFYEPRTLLFICYHDL